MRNPWRALVVLFLSFAACGSAVAGPHGLQNNEWNAAYTLGGDDCTVTVTVFCPPKGIAGTYNVKVAEYENGDTGAHAYSWLYYQDSPSAFTVVTTSGTSTFADGSVTKSFSFTTHAVIGNSALTGDPNADAWIGQTCPYTIAAGFWTGTGWLYPEAGDGTVDSTNAWQRVDTTITIGAVADDGSNGTFSGFKAHPYTGINVGTFRLTLIVPQGEVVSPVTGATPTFQPSAGNGGTTAGSGNPQQGQGSSNTGVDNSGSTNATTTVTNNNNATVNNTNSSTSTVNNSGSGTGGSGSSNTVNNNDSVVNNTITNNITNNYTTNSGGGASDEAITAGSLATTNSAVSVGDLPSEAGLLSEATNNAVSAQAMGDALVSVVPAPLVSQGSTFGTMPDPVMNFWGHTQTIPISTWRPVTDKFRELILLVLLIWFWFRVAAMMKDFLQSL